MKKGGKRSNTKIHPWSTRNKSMCSASHKTCNFRQPTLKCFAVGFVTMKTNSLYKLKCQFTLFLNRKAESSSWFGRLFIVLHKAPHKESRSFEVPV